MKFAETDAIFSDNYIYIASEVPRVIELYKKGIKGANFKDAKELAEKLLIRSLRDTY